MIDSKDRMTGTGPSKPGALQQNLPVIGAAVHNIILLVAILSIPLASAKALALSAAETSGWILALFGLTGLLSLVLSLRYRQPLLVTGNLFFIIFIRGLEGQVSFAELAGAAALAGVVVLLIGIVGLSERLAVWIPVPIMFGMLAGAVMPFLQGLFTELGGAPAVVGGTLLVYLLSRSILGHRLPAILPALVTGIVVAAVSGQFGELAGPLSLVLPRLAPPVFSLPAILTATPVFVVLITLQANLPSMRFLHSQNYHPPGFVIDMVSGLGTILGSFLGPTGVSLSLPATAVVAGPGAGEPGLRHRAVYLVGTVALLVGILAGVAAGLAEVIPAALLATLAGLALVDVLADAVKRVAQGPLLYGPLFAFAISLSSISFLGFGNYFWALVIGTAVSLLLERDALRALRQQQEEELA
jgi:benzoate membrane transport protein